MHGFRSVAGLVGLVLLGFSNPSVAQTPAAKKASPKSVTQLPTPTKAAATTPSGADPIPNMSLRDLNINDKVQIGNVGLMMPDAQWKQFKTGLPPMQVGSFVEYEIEHPELNLGSLRMSIVPQSDLPTPAWRVLELRSKDATGDVNYVKVAFNHRSTDFRNARGFVFKGSGLPPFILPLNQAESQGSFSVNVESSKLRPAKVRYLGKATVEVPAGRFECWHYRMSGEDTQGKAFDSELWFDLSGVVPVLRVVQARNGKTLLKLKAHGKGAKSDLPYIPVPGSEPAPKALTQP